MITAEQARELSGPTVDQHLEYLEKRIRLAAEAKKSEVIVRDQPYAMWLYGRLESDTVKAVIDQLKTAGFAVDLYYKELQFVDMGLRIRW